MKARIYLFLVFCLSLSLEMIGQVSGTVFRDYNGNGLRDNTGTFSEPFVSGITVTAFPASGASQSTTTNATGNYSFTGLTLPVRIEFTGFGTGDYSTYVSTSSQTSVQFYSSSTSTANFGIQYPSDYCQPNPNILVSCYEPGNAVYPPSGNTSYALVTVPYNSTGPNPGVVTSVASFNQVGAVWGMAYQRSTRRAFSTAILKRHMGLGPLGLGGIYVTNFSTGTGVYAAGFNLQGVSPTNGGSAIDLGSVDRSTPSTPPFDYILPNSVTTDSRDIDAFGKIGKAGYGGADISDDGTKLWTVNLFQRAIIRIDITNSANYTGNVQQFPLSGFSGLPTCTNGVLRPWGINIVGDKGYLGCVCSAENGGTVNNLRAYVLSFDANNPTSFTTEISFPLNYNRENAVSFPSFTAPGSWNTWKDTWASTGLGNSPPEEVAHAQPVLSSIEFDDNGNMILGLLDRFGDQMSYKLPLPLPGNTDIVSGDAAGDILRVCNVSGSWVMEGLPGCPVNDGPGISALSNDGPNNVGEFFYSDAFDDPAFNPTWNHNETYIGAHKVLRGTNEIAAIHYDPINAATAFDLGFLWHNATNGSRADEYRLVDGGASRTKGNGLGDFEFICNPAPIQIGNRVWADTDSDGIQDAGEAPIAGVTVQLLQGTTVIATATTDANGNYYFSNATGTNTASSIYGITQLMPNMAYTVRIPNVQGGSKQPALGTNNLTLSNIGGAGQPDVRDSDGTLVGNDAEVTVMTTDIPTAGANNHTFDFGFGPAPAAICGICPPEITITGFSFGSGSAPLAEDVTTNGSFPLNESNIAGFVADGSSEGIFYTLCTEITQSLLPLQNPYLHAANGSANGFTALQALRIAQVFQAAGFSTANGFGAGNNTTTNMVAMQMAVWNAFYDTDYTISAGNFQMLTDNNPGVRTVANNWLTAAQLITSPNTPVHRLTNPTGQDLVFQNCITTEPSICNAGTNTYSLTGNISFANAPTTGTLTVSVPGGVSHVITLPATSPQAYTITGLTADGTSHTVTAVFSEDMTCIATATYTAPASCVPSCTLSATCSPTPQSSCTPANGGAAVNVTGAQGNLTYIWSSGETTVSISGKNAGTYTVTVTDDFLPNCTATCQAVITSTVVLPTAVCTPGANTNCASPNGSASVSTNATSPTYLWSNNATTMMISNLNAGTYTVTVTDPSTGCTNTCQAVVTTTTTPPTLSVNIVTQNTSCTTPNGSISTTTNAANPTYVWSNGATTSGLTNLSAGTFNVTVTDGTTGCNNTGQATITNPLSPTCSLTATGHPSCPNLTGGSISAQGSGGQSPYSFAWSNGASGPSASGLTGGTYTVTVTDAGNCTSTCQVTLDTPMNCCNINVIVPQNVVCLDNGTPNLHTDNRIRFSANVTNTNLSLTGYNVTINGGTTITPNANVPYGVTQFILGPGTAGGGATFTITVTDTSNPSTCTRTFTVTDPGGCNNAIQCPTPNCGTAVIQVNGN
jgi:hypothetical protein